MTPAALLEDPRVRAAMAAYELEARHVAAVAIASDGAVVIVTAGSRKVRWRPGMTVAPLSAGDRGEVKACAMHGPYGADLSRCPWCARGLTGPRRGVQSRRWRPDPQWRPMTGAMT